MDCSTPDGGFHRIEFSSEIDDREYSVRLRELLHLNTLTALGLDNGQLFYLQHQAEKSRVRAAQRESAQGVSDLVNWMSTIRIIHRVSKIEREMPTD